MQYTNTPSSNTQYSMKKVFIAGGVSVDSIIYLPEFPKPVPQTIHQCLFNEAVGSTGSGKALNMCRLGFDVVLHAMIGDDSFGRFATEELKQKRLDFRYNFDPNGTERHTNIMNKNGERISIFTNNISADPKIDYQQFIPLIEEADYVIVNLSDYTKKILPMVKELGKPVWTDLHDYDGQNPWHADYVKYADYVLLSSDNMPDYKPFMKKMMDEGKELVVVTHGKQGSTGLGKNGQWFDIEINNSFQLVDSNGAGDAYFSGFLYGFNKDYSIEKCMQYGTLTGGLCINSDKLYHQELSEFRLMELFEQFYGNYSN